MVGPNGYYFWQEIFGETDGFYFWQEIFGETDTHNQHQKPKCNLSVAALTGNHPTSAFICPYPWPLSGPQTRSNKSPGHVPKYCP